MTCVIKASAPLSELQTYATQLKSIAATATTYDYSHDEPTPPHVQEEVVRRTDPHDDDD